MSKKKYPYKKRRLRSSYFTTLISITLVLLMLGVLGLIILHAKKLSDYVKENIGVRIMMKEDAREADIIQLQKTLDAKIYVKYTEYITPEKAAEEMKKELGEDFISFLGYNPLPPSIDLRLKADFTSMKDIEFIKKEILVNQAVKEIFYQKSLVQSINTNLNRISLALLGFSSLLMLIAIALINNTIRLSVFAKRLLIRSMQLLGATQSFIRRPFILKSIFQGIYAALIAIVLISVLVYFSLQELPELIEIQDINLFITLFCIIICCGILISWCSTYFAIKKYLKMQPDDLY